MIRALAAAALSFLIALPVSAQTQPPEARAFTGEYSPGMLTQSHKKQERQPNVEIWLPPDFQKSEEKWPLLIFSHGFGGCAKQSEFLTAYLAEQGYIVIAPDHADAHCHGKGRTAGRLSGLSSRRGGVKDWPEKPFKNPEKWTDATEADRKDDILFALSSMLDDRQYKNYVDTDRMGLIGYDLGGHTVLGLSGAWPSWKDARFKAAVALSPYLGPYSKGKIRNVTVPVLYQGGTRDTMNADVRRLAYPQTNTPKYYIEYDGATHESWTESARGYQDIIRRSVLVFADKYVKGKNDAVIDETRKPKVKTFWHDGGGGADAATRKAVQKK